MVTDGLDGLALVTKIIISMSMTFYVSVFVLVSVELSSWIFVEY